MAPDARQGPVRTSHPRSPAQQSRGNSSGKFPFLGAPRRIGFPAIAPRTMPVELARLKTATLATVKRQAAGMLMHQILDQLKFVAEFGRCLQQLDLEKVVQSARCRIE